MTDWLVQTLHAMGYGGIFLLLVLARVVPPVPAETVIPLAGLGAANGEFSLVGIALAGGLGSLVGQLVWYFPSRLWTPERLDRFLKRHGHWLTIRPRQVGRATRWFQTRGAVAVLLVQPLPGLRTLISIPAGAARMPVWRYGLASATGSILWTGALAWSGSMLATWPGITGLFGYATVALLVLLLGIYAVRLARHGRGAHDAGTMPHDCPRAPVH